jgi:alcohol dehydrogenase (cytochrome c)
MKLRTLLFLLCAAALWSPKGQAQVSFDRIVAANDEPQNWLTYSGTNMSQRYSLLKQITPQNVKNLELQWVWQARSLEKFEATSLVVDGVLYTIQDPNDVVALDAITGRILWMYQYIPSPESRPCCGRVNRGLAILGNTLFMGTIDAHVVAIDAKDGKPLWNTTIASAKAGYALTHAPLVVKDKVIVGTAGGEYGIRGFIAAYDVHTGKEVWRFYTIAGPDDPNHKTWESESWKQGGGSVWVTGSYDADLNLTYWGIGNPAPSWNGDSRPGDNLYTDSVVALDADTGKLKWHYQFSPHDEFDYDAVQIPVLADMPWQGKDGQKKTRKVMMWANRNGLYYVLDRASGEFLLGKPFVEVNWMNGFDEKGRPMRVPGKVPSADGTVIYPGNAGGTSWYSPSFSPRTGLFYIPTWSGYYSKYFKEEQEYVEGMRYVGGYQRGNILQGLQTFRKESEGYGAIRALDASTGEKKWDFKMPDVTESGVLTTASDVLFSGGRDGYVFALDAKTGEPLWRTSLGAIIASGPMTYSVKGRQYISVAAGNALFSFALKQ